VGTFDLTGDAFARVPLELRYEGEKAVPPAGYWIVQLRPSPKDAEAATRVREDVRRAGGRVVGNLPVAAFVARMSAEAAQELARAPEVQRVERYHPALKLAPWLGRTPLPDPLKAISGSTTSTWWSSPREDTWWRRNRATGRKVRRGRHDVCRRCSITVGCRSWPRSSVRSIEGPLYPQGEETTATMQTGTWRHGGLRLRRASTAAGCSAGDGHQILLILDDGIQLDAEVSRTVAAG
jgi:hypothetical protein